MTRERLRIWIDNRQREAAHRGTIMGGKYPHLCMMIDLLLELEPESRFVHIYRPVEESVRSLIDRSARETGWLNASPEQCATLQHTLWDTQVHHLAKVSSDRVLRVRYDALLADPANEVDRMTEFLGLQVRPNQREHAVELVRPVAVGV